MSCTKEQLKREKLYDKEFHLDKIFELNEKLTKKDKELIKKAYFFAEFAHRKQKRKSGEPYFIHLVSTAKNLAKLEMDGTVISAGLLHDSIEDGAATDEEIKKEFGQEIYFLVDGVTKLGTIRFQGMKRHNESLRKLFIATSKDLRVLIIKFADRIHNLQTLHHIKPEKQRRIALESLEIYTQLAFRLGMTEISKELGDLAFPYAYPKEYKKVKNVLKERGKENLKNLDQISRSLTKKFALANITDFSLSYRVKAVLSLYKKLEKKKWNADKIYDIIALRIVLPDVADCYKVLGVIHKYYRPLPGRIKDYIALPKPNGYQSIHTTIFTGHGGVLEIQIRTEQMDKEAKYGVASHLGYKAKTELKNKNKKNEDWVTRIFSFSKKNNEENEKESCYPKEINMKDPKWISELADYSDDTEDDNFKNKLKEDFFSDRIFVFSPNGDVVDLAEDSTPVDFAFQIHTTLGISISGVKINGVFKSIDTVLKNGDVVEIETNKNAKPTIKWLEFVKSSTAKRRIKHFLEKNNNK